MSLDVVYTLCIVDMFVIRQDIVKRSSILRDVDGYVCVFSPQSQEKILEGLWANPSDREAASTSSLAFDTGTVRFITVFLHHRNSVAP